VELKEVEGQLHRLRFYLSSLSDMQRRFEGYADGVRAIMTSEDASMSKGIIGVLADMVEVVPPYEAALEAALGYTLQSLIVTGHEEAFKAIRYLKEGGLGRGSFLSLDAIRHRFHDPTPQEPRDRRFLGPLLDFISIKEKVYRPLVEALLEGVWLVQDLEGITAKPRRGSG
jgi:chromosome segregation protein